MDQKLIEENRKILQEELSISDHMEKVGTYWINQPSDVEYDELYFVHSQYNGELIGTRVEINVFGGGLTIVNGIFITITDEMTEINRNEYLNYILNNIDNYTGTSTRKNYKIYD